MARMLPNTLQLIHWTNGSAGLGSQAKHKSPSSRKAKVMALRRPIASRSRKTGFMAGIPRCGWAGLGQH
jgi:hypothetical protein